MWHIVLLPIVLIAITGAHVLLVRVRGVSHPIDTDAAGAVGRGRLRRRAIAAASAASWRGPNRRYDILKEGAIAAVIVLALTLGLAGCCPPQTSRRSPSPPGPGWRPPTSWPPPPPSWTEPARPPPTARPTTTPAAPPSGCCSPRPPSPASRSRSTRRRTSSSVRRAVASPVGTVGGIGALGRAAHARAEDPADGLSRHDAGADRPAAPHLPDARFPAAHPRARLPPLAPTRPGRHACQRPPGFGTAVASGPCVCDQR
jgi:hypothetical protein